MPESEANATHDPPPARQGVLVINTASRPGYVALLAESGEPPRRRIFTHFRRQSEELFPLLQTLFEQYAVALPHLRAIAVATGPGSFSAVRVGLTAAKSLAETTGLPLVGVSLLDAASDHCPNEHRIVVLPASRNQCFAAAYGADNRLVLHPRVATLQEVPCLPLPDGFQPRVIICTETASVTSCLRNDAVAMRIEDCTTALDEYFMQRSQARSKAADWDDPLVLDALYVRRDDADGQWTDRNQQH